MIHTQIVQKEHEYEGQIELLQAEVEAKDQEVRNAELKVEEMQREIMVMQEKINSKSIEEKGALANELNKSKAAEAEKIEA